MNITFLLLSVLAASISTALIIPKWITKAKTFGLVGRDMNKPDHPEVAEMGGLCIIWGFGIGLLLYIGLDTFIVSSYQQETYRFLAVYCTILMIGIIGMMDDLLGWKKGITNWKKPFLVLPATVPMIVINAGSSGMDLPFIGIIDWGILYPLIIIPLAITCASNGFNIIAGYTGLEAGMGMIILSTMAIIAGVNQVIPPLVLSVCMVATLGAFYWFNKNPAKIFPGDTMTYVVGALISCVAILGNMEKAALILFLPYIIDIILVSRSRFKAEAFAGIREDGLLVRSNSRYYKLTDVCLDLLSHTKGGATEQRVVGLLFCFEGLLAVIVMVISLHMHF